MRTNADLTVYNKYIDPATRSEAYQRASIKAVTWEGRKGGTVLTSGGQIELDLARVFIPLARGVDFLSPKAWQALDDRTGIWTFQIGDVIVRGVITDEITTAMTDPITHVVTPAFTVSKLRAKYDDVLVITSVDLMDAGSLALRHWQVGAR
jgi:hypothetical protein